MTTTTSSNIHLDYNNKKDCVSQSYQQRQKKMSEATIYVHETKGHNTTTTLTTSSSADVFD